MTSKLSDYISFKNGKKRPQNKGKYPIYGGNGILDYCDNYNSNAGIIIGRVGAYCGNVYLSPQPFWASDNAIYAINKENSDLTFDYYLLKFLKLNCRHIGTSQPLLTQEILNNIEYEFPNLNVQVKIATILKSLDNKIMTNNQINKNLEEQAKILFQKFFSPKSGIEGNIVTLDKYCNIFTGKKNSNDSIKNGKYKFFTCSPNPLLIDSYIYDGNAIIISGNGAYTGRTRFYSGKFDLYQRTYACTLQNNIDPNFIFPLYWFVKLELSKKIMGGTRGSAIPYIVFNDLAKFKFIYNKDIFSSYMPLFKNITETIQQNEFENERLSLILNTLLPKLIAGEIDVTNINI